MAPHDSAGESLGELRRPLRSRRFRAGGSLGRSDYRHVPTQLALPDAQPVAAPLAAGAGV